MGETRSAGHRVVLFGGILVTTVVLLGFGATALAQEQQQEKPPEFKEEVTVTGTLIPRPTLEAMAPVTSMDIEELSYRGIERLEDLLTTLPQVFAAQNSTVSNGSSGTATVNLRNLGSQRTLVLIDGIRMSSGGRDPAADLNFIPAVLVKRVDVLTGGASATYGADAVAGVVNFIMDKDFEGIKGSVDFGGYQHNNDNKTYDAMDALKGFTAPTGSTWDGGVLDASVALGGKLADGKGHATGYIDYRRISAVLKSARDYTNCAVTSLNPAGARCSGSGTTPNGSFFTYSPDFSVENDYTLNTTGSGNTFRDKTGSDVFNFAPYNYLQRPDQRFAAGGFVSYEWNKHFQAYVDVMLMSDNTDAQIAPSGDFGNTYYVNCDNPMLSADEYQKICGQYGYGAHDLANVTILRRSLESGPRTDYLKHTDFRLVAGLKGEIDKVWSYDTYGLDAEVSAPESYGNELSITRTQDALLVAGDPNDPSTWHCISGNPGCVPWNIFKVGGVTQAAVNYLRLPEIYDFGVKTQQIQAKLTGDLKGYGLAFPGATEGIGVALGADYRKEFLYLRPDYAYQTGDGQGGAATLLPVSGFYDVKELFGEVQVPIVQGARGAKDLSLNAGYRWSDYNVNGQHPTYKIEGDWAPDGNVKVRAGFNRATRAPNVNELFTPQEANLGGSTDPCWGTAPTATQAQCALTGVSAAQYGHISANPASQYNSISGGNPNLKPETADTVTYGLVITPEGSGLTAAFDYYRIKIKDVIGSLLPDNIISACIATGNPTLCSLIHRDQVGSLWLSRNGYITSTNANVGALQSEGVDANLTYVRPIGTAGVFSANLIGTYLMHSITDTGLYTYDCVGYFGDKCNNFYGTAYGLTPKWRHYARFSWETSSNMVFSLGWRMVGAVTNEAASSNSSLSNPANIPALKADGSYHWPAYHYIDLAVTYKMKSGVTLNLGVNNVADKEPPLGAGMAEYDYGTGWWGAYDVYGRYVHGSVQFAF